MCMYSMESLREMRGGKNGQKVKKVLMKEKFRKQEPSRKIKRTGKALEGHEGRRLA